MIINSVSINATEINDSQIEIGTLSIVATLQSLEGLFYAIDNTSTINATLPELTARFYSGGFIDAELPELTALFSLETSVSTSIEANLPSLTASFSLEMGQVGVIAATLPSFTAEFHSGGIIASSLPNLQASFQLATGSSCIIASELPNLSARFDLLSGQSLSIEATLPNLVMPYGEIVAILPALTASFESLPQEHNLVAYAMNIKNTETTTYTNYDFKFIIRIGHEYYGVKTDGLYKLTGITDNGIKIKSKIRTADQDFGTANLKRLVGAYLASDKATKIVTIAEGNSQGIYQSSFGGRRIKFGRGSKARFWQLEVNNVDGNSMQIGALELLAETLSRKV